jgi:hypothetical protein
MKHRIICVIEESVAVPVFHTHIVGVGTGPETERLEKRWTVNEVIHALAAGERFYTQGVASEKMAEAEIAECPYCKKATLKSGNGVTTDNDLSSLRWCPMHP